ncbi:MAG: hypothetical protein LBL65_02560 [Campylobacteraceae bacterium]|jgi:hypothetical protein|nr:hypothetical protein [Campylobacteraceae bacterium]
MKKRLTKKQEKALENTLEEETSSFLINDGELSDKKWLYGLLYFILWRVKDIYYSIKYMMQRIFRPNHLSDMELWNLDLTMAKWIYPRLNIFVEEKRYGYPGIFSEYNENEWTSKEQYDKAIKSEKHLGGGADAWDEILQEMIFAFEWKIYYENYNDEKQRDKFCKKWGIKNPYEKNLENKRINYVYNNLESGFAECISDDSELDKKGSEKYLFLRRYVYYHDVKYDTEIIAGRAQKGFELFGKYFLNLWD